MDTYSKVAFKSSEIVTQKYSTSFSIAVRLLPPDMRRAIYSIYGFVRFADEIVDTFHDINQRQVLEKFESDYYTALEQGISMNPIIHSFAVTVKKYDIPDHLVDSFLKSMKADLYKKVYHSEKELSEYIYGSANVVGLMCLKVFCYGNPTLYDELEHSAEMLGSAFQKVNFLRDYGSDESALGRSYFPETANSRIDAASKKLIERSIDGEFNEAWHGLVRLPGRSKLAVALAFFYYKSLFNKIKESSPERLVSERIRINNLKKYFIVVKVGMLYKTRMF